MKQQSLMRLLLYALLLCLLLSGCGQNTLSQQTAWDELQFDYSLELAYADQFTVDYYQGGYAKITIGGTDTYLLVPEDAAVPDRLPDTVTVLQQT